MFRFILENSVIVTVAILIICLLGVVSMFNVPVQMTAQLSSDS